MTTRRRLLVFGLLAALAITGACSTWALWPHPSAITWENAEKIQEGMTLEDVEAILGGPARCEATTTVTDGRNFWAAPREHAMPGVWQSDSAVIEVRFDNGFVGWSHCFLVHRYEDSLLDKLRSRFRL